MRVAPAGLAYGRDRAFDMGVQFAALTHGHPSGYLSAGALAHIVAAIIEGFELKTAVKESIEILKNYAGHAECVTALQMASTLAGGDLPDNEAIAKLGEGWVGEEALAIAIYCSLKHQDDYRKAVTVAVNHSGDSDSTGSITGNIVGAYLGISNIPVDWLKNLELREVITQIADDLLPENRTSGQWQERYPVW